MRIKEILKEKNITQKDFAKMLDITPCGLYQQITAPSFPTLSKWAKVLNVPIWQIVAPSEIVEEVRAARAAASVDAGGALVGVVRVGDTTYTANNIDELRGIVERLSNSGAGGKG